MRIVVLANTAWYLHNFRSNLMRALQEAEHEVIAVSPHDEYVMSLEAAGFTHREWKVKGAGVNPFEEFFAIYRLYRLLREVRADVVLSFTPKCNIHGGIAARLAGTRIINNVSGLGRVFIEKTLLTSIVILLYKVVFRWSAKVFFQNEEDQQQFISHRIVDPRIVDRLPGSGVDLQRFTPSREGGVSSSEGGIIFLLVARLLWDKGIGEYVEAARMVKSRYPTTRFQVLGFLGVDNPAAISRKQVTEWEREGVVEYLGSVNDVTSVVSAADCVVLPSYYREGVPRTLLEAAAMAKPIITTDVAGCRDTVQDRSTGFLCRTKDSADLAEKMFRLIELPVESRLEMGRLARGKMEREFDESIVIGRYLAVVETLRDSAA